MFDLLLVPAKQLTVSHLQPSNTDEDGVWTPRVEAASKPHITNNGDLSPRVQHSLVPVMEATIRSEAVPEDFAFGLKPPPVVELAPEVGRLCW